MMKNQLAGLMKQAQYAPLQVWQQALTLFAADNHYYEDIPVEKVLAADKAMHDYVQTKYPDFVAQLERDKAFNKDVEAKMHEVLKDFKQNGAF